MSYSYAYPHPAVTTDVVIFTIRDHMLELLLIRRGSDPFKNSWALPGGFVNIDEDLEACALRELEEETGVTGLQIFIDTYPSTRNAISCIKSARH